MSSSTIAARDRLASEGAVFPGDGEMARRCRALDWARTSLGPVAQWPNALRIAVRLAIECPFPINLWCGEDLLLIYNDGYRQVLGAKHPDALGRSGRDVWVEIWPEIEPMFEGLKTGGPATYAEDERFIMERAGGPPGEAWFTYSVSPVRSEDGAIVAFLNIATESTRRLLAERVANTARAAAERAEMQLRAVFAQAPAFLAVLRGPHHIFEFVNDAYRRLIGDRDVVGKPVAEGLPEVVEQGFVGILDSVLRDNEPFIGREVPVMLARQQGGALEPRYVDFVYQPLTDLDGRPTGVVAHGSDVTEAVMARRVIEESEARYRFLANTIPVQVWTAAPDGTLNYVSSRTAEYFGRSAEAVIGDQWLSVLHPDDAERTLERWRQSVTTGMAYEIEFRLFHAASRQYRWHLSRADAQRDEQGNIVRWVGTNTDIEDRKQWEAELQRLTAEATEANKAKSAFLAAMSHELRTPLNAIGGYAQLIEMGLRGPVTEQQRTDLLKIQRSKNHLDALVSDILNFAKLSAGKVEFRFSPVRVDRAIAAVVDMMAPQLAVKGLNLEVAPISPGVMITADEDKLRQILLNLLSNAVKFTPRGGMVGISAVERAGELQLQVSDTGTGIASEYLDRIFEPFVQANSTTAGADQGVGLGLAISRQLARAMGGDLSVTSQPGEGSVFTLTIPQPAS